LHLFLSLLACMWATPAGFCDRAACERITEEEGKRGAQSGVETRRHRWQHVWERKILWSAEEDDLVRGRVRRELS